MLLLWAFIFAKVMAIGKRIMIIMKDLFKVRTQSMWFPTTVCLFIPQILVSPVTRP